MRCLSRGDGDTEQTISPSAGNRCRVRLRAGFRRAREREILFGEEEEEEA